MFQKKIMKLPKNHLPQKNWSLIRYFPIVHGPHLSLNPVGSHFHLSCFLLLPSMLHSYGKSPHLETKKHYNLQIDKFNTYVKSEGKSLMIEFILPKKIAILQR